MAAAEGWKIGSGRFLVRGSCLAGSLTSSEHLRCHGMTPGQVLISVVYTEPVLLCRCSNCCCWCQPKFSHNGEGSHQVQLTGTAVLMVRRQHGGQHLGPGRKARSWCTCLRGCWFWNWDGLQHTLFRCAHDDLSFNSGTDGEEGSPWRM